MQASQITVPRHTTTRVSLDLLLLREQRIKKKEMTLIREYLQNELFSLWLCSYEIKSVRVVLKIYQIKQVNSAESTGASSHLKKN